MTARDPALVNLLLASAPALRFWRNERGIAFRRAWMAAISGEGLAPEPIKTETGRALLRLALQVCEAADISRMDLISEFNDRGESGDRAEPGDLNALLDQTIELLAHLIVLRRSEIQRHREGEMA